MGSHGDMLGMHEFSACCPYAGTSQNCMKTGATWGGGNEGANRVSCMGVRCMGGGWGLGGGGGQQYIPALLCRLELQ